MFGLRRAVVVGLLASSCGTTDLRKSSPFPGPNSPAPSLRASASSPTDFSGTALSATVRAALPPAIATSTARATLSPVPSTSPPEALAKVHFVGRFDRDPPGPGATFTWSGTAFHAQVRGTGASIRLSGASGVYFEVRVDGERARVFSTQRGARSYPLFRDRPLGIYEVEVYRRNEASAGKVTYRGFDVDGGELVASPPPHRRRIEVLGDSITCGYGTEGPKGCTFSHATESAYVSYAAVAARALDASAHLICFSGKGLIQNYGGGKHEPMPQLYGRTLLHDKRDTWDASRYAADVVVVNLGTNDISAELDHDAFVDAYVALLKRARRLHPEALLVAIRWEHWGTSKQHLVSDAVARVPDDRLLEVQFNIKRDEGMGCDAHPSTKTHARLGKSLAELLRRHL